MGLTLEQADSVIAAGKEKAIAIGVPVNIVVTDQGGFLKEFARMDGALLGSIEIAQKKAKTAILFEMNTEAVFEFCKPGAPAFGLEQTNGGLAVFAGGIPLRNAAGTVIGAVGVSGGTVQQDFSVAEAAIAITSK
ncbi:MAG TPA: heme-binding protein [Edaphobacter sp.]|nr:heme-binding protein [Edaphobacter sp.]